MVLMEVNPQGVRAVIGINPEDHVGEPADQSESLRLDGELPQCLYRQRSKTPDLSRLGE